MPGSVDKIQSPSLSGSGTMLEKRGIEKTGSQVDASSTCDSELRGASLSGEFVEGGGLHRRLGNRQIQLMAIGGSIGTAIFVTIGTALENAGPGNLLLAYFLHNIVLGLVNSCMAEMAVFMPVSGGFIRLASRWVDEAWGFMAGWNFFLYEALNIPFEITAINTVLSFWRDDIPAAAVCAACIVLYG